jgi:hypothetical protein
LLPLRVSVPGFVFCWPERLRDIPVVVPDFILLVFILWDVMLVFILWDFIRVLVAPGPTLPSLDAPGAGCVCAGATDVIPTSEATARAESASLDSMGKLLLRMWVMQELEPTMQAWVPSVLPERLARVAVACQGLWQELATGRPDRPSTFFGPDRPQTC